jgi:hypothetical protein
MKCKAYQLRYDSSCPQCGARAGAACRNKEGQKLPGTHFQRNSNRRRAVAAAIALYAPLQLQIKERFQ